MRERCCCDPYARTDFNVAHGSLVRRCFVYKAASAATYMSVRHVALPAAPASALHQAAWSRVSCDAPTRLPAGITRNLHFERSGRGATRPLDARSNSALNLERTGSFMLALAGGWVRLPLHCTTPALTRALMNLNACATL